MPAWDRPARWSRSRTARSPAGPARRSRISCAHGVAAMLELPEDSVHVIWKTGPRLLRPQRCRRRGDGCRACSPRRSASRCACNICATRAPAGIRKARPRSIKARAAIDAAGNVIAYDFVSKAFSRVDVDTNGSKPYDTLAGQTHRRRAEVRRRLRHPGGILRLRQQAHGLGNDPAAARPRLAAAHLASARSGRAANPLRQRILHGRSGGGAQSRRRSSSGCATSRIRATSR